MFSCENSIYCRLHPSERRTFKAIQIEVVKLENPFIVLDKLVATNVTSTDIIL